MPSNTVVDIPDIAVVHLAQASQEFTVSDEKVCRAMYLFWRELHMVIEPSSATVIKAITNHPEIFAGKRIGVIISGSNIDPGHWKPLTNGDQNSI